MKIVVTDCDHDGVEIERVCVEAAGGHLVRCQDARPEAVIENAVGAHGILVQYAQITADVLDALPTLSVISRYGVGVDTVDVAAATARGIAVCNVPDYATEAVSDHAIALTLSVVRDISGLDRRLRRGNTDALKARPVHQIRGRFFGVVGAGAIGRATARKAQGLGFDVALYDPALTPGTRTDEGFAVLDFKTLLSRSQVLSLHVPLTDDTYHLLNERTLAQLPEGAIVINTARGGVVDTEALSRALAERRLLGAGLDVFEDEPLPADHPLTGFERVTLTPHAGFYSEESFDTLKERTAQNAVDVIAGRRPAGLVNTQVKMR